MTLARVKLRSSTKVTKVAKVSKVTKVAKVSKVTKVVKVSKVTKVAKVAKEDKIIEVDDFVKRCQLNLVRLNDDKNDAKILTIQMLSSKLIFNKGLYCQRIWFSRVHIQIIQYYIDNLDIYLDNFSTEDKLTLFKILMYKRDVKNMNKILSCIEGHEYKKFVNARSDALTFIKTDILIDVKITKNDSNINYIHNFKTISDIINKIKIRNFSDKYGDLDEYLTILKEAIDNKIKNEKKTSVNKKQKKSKKIKFHKIPSSYLNTDIVESYVKKQFELERIQLNKKDNMYNLIGSQVAQQTLKKLDKSFVSFFGKKKKNLKANIPSYLKSDRFNLIFQKTSFTEYDDYDNELNKCKYIKLSLGKLMKKKQIAKNKDYDGFMHFKVPENINGKIIEVEISPNNDRSTVSIAFKYNKPKPEPLDTNNINKMSLDMGEVNLVTLYSPILDNPLIYKGGHVKYINRTYKNLIEKKQSMLKKRNNLYTSNKTSILWRKRHEKIKGHFNKISSNIIKVCTSNKITEIIIGYNKNWKTNVNMGRLNNDRFYKIPYKTLIQMIFNKGEEKGITVIENNESYTSKCDALNLESVGYHENYSGNRKKRGLFQSFKGVLLNADVNGAINIMRKALWKKPAILKKLEKSLDCYRKICNPITIKISV
jgi:putative transposase